MARILSLATLHRMRAARTTSCARTALRYAAVGLLCVLALAGCGGGTRATRTTGPDGEDGWWRITCRNDHQECIDEAAELCPMGYEVGRNKGRYDVGPGFPYYSGVMLVRCKDDR